MFRINVKTVRQGYWTELFYTLSYNYTELFGLQYFDQNICSRLFGPGYLSPLFDPHLLVQNSWFVVSKCQTFLASKNMDPDWILVRT